MNGFWTDSKSEKASCRQIINLYEIHWINNLKLILLLARESFLRVLILSKRGLKQKRSEIPLLLKIRVSNPRQRDLMYV
jgi:hypothetical protein